jgi:nitroreductase
MPGASSDVWEVMSTARTMRRFTDEPVDDATLARCLRAATWAPSGANAQAWRFVVLRSPEQRAVVATAAARALEVIELPNASELLLGGSIFPAMQNFLLAARAQGLGACLTSWASYGGERLLRNAVGVPDEWMMAGHIVVGWPKGTHGPVRRRPLAAAVNMDHWDQPAADLLGDNHSRGIE